MVARYFYASLAGLWLLGGCTQQSAEPSGGGEEAQSANPPAAPAPAPAAARPAPAAPSAGGMPATIVADRGGFIPEGVEYDQTYGRFLTGSLAEGSIFEIGMDGSVTPVVTDPELVSSVGIEVDEPRDRILVCNSDAAVFQNQGPGQAKLGVYSLTTGERLAMVDMGATTGSDGPFFTNDVTVADDGTVYATDTRQNVVYAVNTSYEPSLFYRFPATENLALNGIVYDPDGYLLIADLGNGAIYKTPITNPGATRMVSLPEPLNGIDGMVWRADGALAIVQNSAENGRVVALTSDDDWASARIVGISTHEGAATTAAAAGSDIYAVHPHFNDQDPPSIERAVFR
jgi:sugar lactone lactonase YvrE